MEASTYQEIQELSRLTVGQLQEKSLSAIAKEVTGSKWNGFLFFGLTGGGPTNGHTSQGVSE